jgi:hypothetical protein
MANLDKKLSGQRKKEFIEWYYDTSKKILKKHGKEITEEIKKSLKGSDSDYDHDEVVFNQYKVKEVYIVSSLNRHGYTELLKDKDFRDIYIGDTNPLEPEYKNLVKAGFEKQFKGVIEQEKIPLIDKEKGKTPDKLAFWNYKKLKTFWNQMDKIRKLKGD